jgi:Protein of unknown function (DUF2530)
VRSLPPVLEVILRPDRRRPNPPALDVDMRRVFLVGIALWLVGLVVTAVLWRAGSLSPTPVWTCAAGAALGGVGLAWERLRRRTGSGTRD